MNDPGEHTDGSAQNHSSARVRTRRRVSVGVVIDSAQLTAVEVARSLTGVRPRRVFRRAVPPPDDAATPRELSAAFSGLAEALAHSRIVADIALATPICHLKRITLPSASRRDLRRMVARNAHRFFPIGGGPAIADVDRAGPFRRTRRKRLPRLAAAAEAAVVEAVLAAADDAGIRVRTITPAGAAAASGLSCIDRRLRRRTAAVLLAGPGGPHILFLHRGLPALVRTLPAAGRPGARGSPGGPGAEKRRANIRQVVPDAVRIMDEVRQQHGFVPAVITALGWPDDLDPLSDALGGTGTGRTVEVARPRKNEPLPADVATAVGAARTGWSDLQLLSPGRRAARRRRDRRRASVLGLLAVLLLVLAAALHLVDVRREIGAVEARRAAIAPTVTQALHVRATLDSSHQRLVALKRLDSSRILWTPWFTALAQALPRASYVRAFAAGSTEVRLRVRAGSAADVMTALTGSGWFHDPEFTSPVRRQEDDGRSVDVFSLTAGIQPPSRPMARASSASEQ